MSKTVFGDPYEPSTRELHNLRASLVKEVDAVTLGFPGDMRWAVRDLVKRAVNETANLCTAKHRAAEGAKVAARNAAKVARYTRQ